MHNWNWQLLGIVLNYFGWLLVVLGGWKKKKNKKIDLNLKKIWFKSNKSDFLKLKKKKKKKIANPDFFTPCTPQQFQQTQHSISPQ